MAEDAGGHGGGAMANAMGGGVHIGKGPTNPHLQGLMQPVGPLRVRFGSSGPDSDMHDKRTWTPIRTPAGARKRATRARAGARAARPLARPLARPRARAPATRCNKSGRPLP